MTGPSRAAVISVVIVEMTLSIIAWQSVPWPSGVKTGVNHQRSRRPTNPLRTQRVSLAKQPWSLSFRAAPSLAR